MLKRELVRGIVISNTCVKLYRNWIINEVARAGEHTNERTYVRTYSHTYVRDRPYIPSTTLLCEGIIKLDKPWFSQECRIARHAYHNARKQYNRYKSDYNKHNLKMVSKNYKSTISRSVRMHQNTKIKKLKNLKNSNPREILNSSDRKKEADVSIHELYTFFKHLNTSGNETDKIYDIDNQNEQVINEQINQTISEQEIFQAIKQLNNNKAAGIDNIKKEHLKSTSRIMVPIYLKLFNIIFDTGIIPESWSFGSIKPVYKNKGDPKLAENYRPITILSCFGKLFTLIINNRLNKYVTEHETIDSCQAGFRKGFSTADNLFIIQSLIDIMKNSHKKLYSCFIDFKQAFDNVWRTGLWQKLIQNDINGKCLMLIRNIYNNIKSNVVSNNESSAFFPCLNGVRQGENLSPFLFAIYLNDLQSYLQLNSVNGIICDINYDDITIFLKLWILLYADDTVLFSSSESDLQFSLNAFKNYCDTWKLTVNVLKTKIVIFGSGKTSKRLRFTFGTHELEITNAYKYLGILLSKSGSFIAAKKNIAEQANKALFSLIKKIRILNLPQDLQLDLFDKTIKPILLYGSEIWGFGNCDVIERVQLKFIKLIFNVKMSTPTNMIYGELGIFPITVDIQQRVVSFWCKLLNGQDANTLSSNIYSEVYAMHENKHLKSCWMNNIKSILCSLGFSGIWYSQSFCNSKWLRSAVKQKLKDTYIQKWYSLLEVSSSSNNYKLFKTTFERSAYINILPTNMCKRLFAFRCRNHRFPVEVGRWRGQPYNERKCIYCQNDLGDEYHYLLICKKFSDARKLYIKPYYYTRPNVLKYHELMNITNETHLRNLSRFVDILLKGVQVS